jgi:YVTN family beta-propeller protein
VRTPRGQFAYVTVGGLNEVKAFRTGNFEQVAIIPVGALPHGIWPSGDGSRVYIGIENGDAVTAIDTTTNRVIATIPNGQAAQALVYVPEAAPTETAGIENLQSLGLAGAAAHLKLVGPDNLPSTTVSLFEQGLTQVLQAAVAGLEPAKPYLLALASNADGTGRIEPLAQFVTNPAGAQVVNAVGPIRQIVDPGHIAAGKRQTWPTSAAPAARDLDLDRQIGKRAEIKERPAQPPVDARPLRRMTGIPRKGCVDAPGHEVPARTCQRLPKRPTRSRERKRPQPVAGRLERQGGSTQNQADLRGTNRAAKP